MGSFFEGLKFKWAFWCPTSIEFSNYVELKNTLDVKIGMITKNKQLITLNLINKIY